MYSVTCVEVASEGVEITRLPFVGLEILSLPKRDGEMTLGGMVRERDAETALVLVQVIVNGSPETTLEWLLVREQDGALDTVEGRIEQVPFCKA